MIYILYGESFVLFIFIFVQYVQYVGFMFHIEVVYMF